MSSPDLVIQSRRVLLPQTQAGSTCEQVHAAVLIEKEKFVGIVSPSEVSKDWPVLDVGNHVIMPGIVDTHAHINEPGRTEWEGFQTATRAAAAGGITTVVDMPLNSIPPTTTLSAFHEKMKAAHERCFIDYGFWGGVIPGNVNELLPMIQSGIMGFKSFLIDSGVKEFPEVQESDLLPAMAILADKVPLLVHAELDHSSGKTPQKRDQHEYSSYLESRPKNWENEAIRWMIQLSQKTGCHVHIVHLSSAEALLDITHARKQGVPITVETCPHYLTLAAEEIPSGAKQFTCAPPIREKSNQNELWVGLQERTIDLIVSDHSPCTPQLKHLESGNFEKAWGGIASIQFSLPVVWTELSQRPGLSLKDIPIFMSQNPASLAGIGNKKGRIAPGWDADLVIWNPEEGFVLEPKMVLHRHSITPYTGRKLNGVVERTILRGQTVYERNSPTPTLPLGRMLKR